MTVWNPSESEKRAFNINRQVEIQRTDLTAGAHILQLLKNARIVTFTTAASAGNQKGVIHGLKDELGRDVTPMGVIPISQDKAGHLYVGGSSWNGTYFYVKSNVSSMTVKAIVFEAPETGGEVESISFSVS